MSETENNLEADENDIILIITDNTDVELVEQSKRYRGYTRDYNYSRDHKKQKLPHQLVDSIEELQNILQSDSMETTELKEMEICMTSQNKAVIFHCNYCSKTFSSQIVLTNHQKCHTGDDLLYCKFCFKCFFQNRDLDEHLTIHEKGNPSSSLKSEAHNKISLKSEAHNKKLRIQSDGETGSETAEEYRCPCFRIYKSLFQYQKHMLVVHGETNKQRCRPSNIGSEYSQMNDDGNYECTVCLKIFKYENSLRAHLEIHSKNVHECPECFKIITTKGWFKQHMKLHHAARPFQCSVCKKSFPDRRRLQRHNYIHGTSLFKCSMCVAEFPHKYLLLDHNKVHLTGSNYNSGDALKILHSKVKLR